MLCSGYGAAGLGIVDFPRQAVFHLLNVLQPRVDLPQILVHDVLELGGLLVPRRGGIITGIRRRDGGRSAKRVSVQRPSSLETNRA